MATQNIPTTNSPKVGSTDSNGFHIELSWSGTYDDTTGAATISFTNRLYSTNNNFSQWTINSDILANGWPVSDVSVQRTLAKNSSVIVNNGTFTAYSWSDWATNNGGATYYLSMTAHADGAGTASYIPNNASVGTTITVTPASTPTSYTVSFDSNGGSLSPSPLSGSSASPITLPSPGIRTNYTFNGWTYNGSNVGTTGQSYTPTGTVTLVASWTYVDPGGGGTTYYSYSYNSNGGSSTPSGSGSIASGTSIILGNPGTKAGYSFSGWYIDSGLTSSAGGIGSSYTITSNTVFYAKWSSSTSNAPTWPSPLPALAQFIAGQPYTDAITASNMTGGTYSISGGSLPGGITINSLTGALSGTVSTGSDYSFTVSAQNNGITITQNYSGSIIGILRVRQNDAWVKTVAKKREGEIWKPGTVRVWSNGTWLYGS